MRPPAQRCMHRWVLRTGQGACGPPPPVAPFRRSFPRRPPAYVLNRTFTGLKTRPLWENPQVENRMFTLHMFEHTRSLKLRREV
jgi:hypothetical protein